MVSRRGSSTSGDLKSGSAARWKLRRQSPCRISGSMPWLTVVWESQQPAEGGGKAEARQRCEGRRMCGFRISTDGKNSNRINVC